ncbi:hypothetical protein HMP0721_2466 [Pseudoramibacter alactolyticus ATCC 23263]|uniref:Uncharacterized protein n=1 Tax=Pseudoramibacter alactolyticus ATCC 23263 TaxID=887929 RepID=E6MKD0_9FIRM|nr:hypothetical protein HMP0721_2466 [Pseudoramibacter alactolyticus ATCC 23263]
MYRHLCPADTLMAHDSAPHEDCPETGRPFLMPGSVGGKKQKSL